MRRKGRKTQITSEITLPAALVCALCALLAAPPSVAGPKVAVMPLVAEALLPSARDQLERDLREAVAACDVNVQSAEQTRRHIDEGAGGGLDCRLTVDECALRVGLIADVDAVLVTSVELVGERMLLRGAYLNVNDERGRRIAGELKMPSADGGVSLRQLVERLVLDKGKPTPLPFALAIEPEDASIVVDGAPQRGPLVWLLPGKHKLEVTAPGRVKLERTIEVAPDGIGNQLAAALAVEGASEEPSAWLYVGVSAASAGLLIAGISFGIAGIIESELQSGQVAFGQRRAATEGGAVLVVVGGFGTALAASGAALALWGPE